MRIVSRYLLGEFARSSAAVFVALVITWVAADTLLHLDQFADDGGQGLRGVALRMLDIVAIGVPLACLAGIVWSLTHAVRNREITAIRCGGIPLRVALVPLLLTAALIALSVAVIEDRVLIPARQVLSQAASQTNGDEARPTRVLDRWWYANGPSVFSARSYDADSRALSDVSVFVFDEQRSMSQRIEAKSAVHVEGSTWDFREATIREFGDGGKLARRSEKSLRVDLGVSGLDLRALATSPRMSTLNKLRRAIRRHSGEAAELASLQTAFHARLAQPIAVLILVLFAIPFAIGDVERGDSLPRALLASIACAGVYWTLWTASLITGSSGLVPPFLPIWGITLTALALGVWRFRRIAE